MTKFVFFRRNKECIATFKPETAVVLKKSYVNDYNDCSKFLENGEVFCVIECRLSGYTDFEKQKK